MKNKRIILFIAISIVVIGGIGGAWYMKREKDLAELHDIQTDLANYLYNNYRLYTRDEEKVAVIYQEFDKGKGTITEQEYFNKLDSIKVYSNIQKIEFIGFSVGPMNSLEVKLIINDIYTLNASSNTVSAETGKLIFDFNTGTGQNNYFLEESEESKSDKFPEKNIVYDNKGVK